MNREQRKSGRTTSVAESTNIVINKHKKVKCWQRVTGVLAVVVLLCATYTMILPALTMEQQTYCGQEEHVYTEACYEQRLICGQEEQHTHKEECYADVETCVCDQEETEGHTHSEECYAEDGTCVCGVEETAGHTHDEACYLVQKELVCTVPVGDASHTHTDNCYEKVLVCGKEEHTHNLMCYSNPEADVESQTAWERSVSGVTLTGVWADDLVAIAESQLGYKESANNYILAENGNIKGYSRYGAWYGDAYGDWCAMFASFCLNYAEIPSVDMPYEASCVRWIKKLSELDMYEVADSYIPQKGDLIFFSSKENGTESDHVGIVSEIITDAEETPIKIHTIEGNSGNMVAERTYELNDSHILGYGKLPENPGTLEEPQMALAAVSEETPDLAEIDLAALTTAELNALLEQITPEDLQAYLESLTDEAYDDLMERLSEEANEILTMFLAGGVSLLATGDTYVGFSKAASDGTVDFANGGGGGGVRKYYLAPYSIYYQYKDSSESTLQQQLLAQSEVAYCFNFHSATPYTVYESKNYPSSRPFTFYNERESASASLFYDNAAYPRSGYSQDALYKKIIAVAMNGYPNDYSGIRSKYNLTADEFRFITQYAVWYYTDSISLGFRTSGGKPQFCVNNDRTGECLTAHSTYYHAFYNANSSYIKAAYQELIGSTLDSATVNTSHINLFKPQNGSSQNLLTVGQENAPLPPPPVTSEFKVQIPAKKTIDGGDTPIGENRFTFKLTGNGQDITVENDENGNILFPEIIYTQPGTYTYTVEEVKDERDGVTFDFDDSVKTVTVTVSSNDVQTYDPNITYYAFDEYDYDSYYYVDTTPGGRGIVMYCTNADLTGPAYASSVAPVNQTYRAIINPTVAEIEAQSLVHSNLYGDELNNRLKQLFYYFETAEGQQISNNDKQSLVWTATDNESRTIDSISVNGEAASRNTQTVLANIFATVDIPLRYNLAFFVPTGTQANSHPQPLMTGYGAVIESTANSVVFNNTSKPQNSLKIGKTVTGTAGETERLFNFTISLMDNSFSALSGIYTVTPDAISGVEKPAITSITFSGGQATVKLKHGQSINIEGLPTGFYYSISEAEWNQDGYTSSVTTGTSGNMNSSGAEGAIEVEFTNHKDAPPPSITYEAEIRAKKTLNGEIPGDGQFTFILRNDQGEEIDRKTNDANGEVVFPLTVTEAGTHTYTVEELNDGQEGIVYDTAVKTVTVTVGSESLQAIVDGSSFVGSHVSDDFYITVNGTTPLDVYCIDGSAGYPGGTYDKVLNPTTAQLAAEVTANYYGNALAENMRKLLYYFDTHSYTDTIGYTTLTKAYRQELIWCLTGNPDQQHWTYTDNLSTILAESNPPSDYAIVMFASTGNAQPVIAGYLPTMNVVYEGEATMVEFANYYEYELPETGGIGTTGYAVGGLLLMSGALLLMYKSKLARKKEGKC